MLSQSQSAFSVTTKHSARNIDTYSQKLVNSLEFFDQLYFADIAKLLNFLEYCV